MNAGGIALKKHMLVAIYGTAYARYKGLALVYPFRQWLATPDGLAALGDLFSQAVMALDRDLVIECVSRVEELEARYS